MYTYKLSLLKKWHFKSEKKIGFKKIQYWDNEGDIWKIIKLHPYLTLYSK